MRKLFPGIFIVVLSLLCIPYVIAPEAAPEPSLMEIFNHLGFTNVAEADVETFLPGIYEVTLYAEFAGYNEENELGYYEVGTSTYNVIFYGLEGNFGYTDAPITKEIDAPYVFGLSLHTPEDHRYFTQHSNNGDGEQHSIVYENLNDPLMYIVGFENIWGAEDRDYQDIVISLKLKTPEQVIPEVPFGTILIAATMLIAFVCFVAYKRFRRPQIVDF